MGNESTNSEIPDMTFNNKNHHNQSTNTQTQMPQVNQSSAMNHIKKSTIGLLDHQASMSTFNSSANLRSLSLSKIYKSKRDRDQEVKQLHTRIQYLQNEENKKMRKINQ